VVHDALARRPTRLWLEAQSHAVTFYEQFGFRKTQGPFLEHGVPFIGLTRQLRASQPRLGSRQRARPTVVDTVELL